MSDTLEVAYVRQLLDEHESRVKTTSQPMTLYDFRKEVEAAIPGCRTTPRNDKWCWVYMPDDHVAMGAIGYGNFTDRGRGPTTYAVMSRTIVNGKYNSGREQHHMATSTSMAVSTKNAKKYLRRHAPTELVKLTSRHARDAVSTMRSNLRAVVGKAEVELFGGNLPNRRQVPILPELKHLMISNHTFLDPTIPAKLTEYFGLLDEDQNSQGGHNMNFVAISVAHGRQRFDVVPVDRIDHYWPTVGDPQVFYEDMPEDILGRVAVLSMVEDGTYVPGVGFRHTEGMFYVAR
jgi:hypothetical protein